MNWLDCLSIPKVIADLFLRRKRIRVPEEEGTGFYEIAQKLVPSGERVSEDTWAQLSEFLTILDDPKRFVELGADGVLRFLDTIPDLNQRLLATGVVLDSVNEAVRRFAATTPSDVMDDLKAVVHQVNAELLGLGGLWMNRVAHSSLLGLGEWVRQVQRGLRTADLDMVNEIRRIGGATEDLAELTPYGLDGAFYRGVLQLVADVVAPVAHHLSDINHPLLRAAKGVFRKMVADIPELADEVRRMGRGIRGAVDEVVDDLFERLYTGKPYRRFSPLTKRLLKRMGLSVKDLPDISNPLCRTTGRVEGLPISELGTVGGLVGTAEALSRSADEVEGATAISPHLPPVETVSDAIDDLGLAVEAPIPEELAEDVAAVVRHLATSPITDPVVIDRMELFVDTFLDTLDPSTITGLLRRLGDGLAEETNPAGVGLSFRNPFFGLRTDRGRLRFYKKANFDAKVDAAVAELLQEFPFLRIYNRDYLTTFVLGRSLGRSLLPQEHWNTLDQIFFSRLLWFTPEEHLPLAIEGLTRLFGGDNLRVFDPQTVSEAVNQHLLRAHIHNLISAAVEKQPLLLDGGRMFLTKADWDALSPQMRMALVDTAIETLSEFLETNLLGVSADEVLQYASGEGVLRNPFVLRSLLQFAEDNGLDLGVALMAGKALSQSAYAIKHLFAFHRMMTGSPPTTHYGIRVLRGEEPYLIGEKPLGRMIREIRDVFKVRYGDISPQTGALDEFITNIDLVGHNLVRHILGMENDLHQYIGEGIDHLYNVGYLLYNQFTDRKGELIHDVIASLGALFLHNPEVVPELVSPFRSPATPYSLRRILEKMGYEDPDETIHWAVEWLANVNTPNNTFRKWRHFIEDLYVPSIVKELLEDDKTAKDFWNFLNDLFKQVLVVYNPSTQLRNFITNLGLMTIGTGAGVVSALREVVEALRGVKEGDLISQRLYRLHPSFRLSQPLEVPEGLEGLLYNATPFQRSIRTLSGLPLLKQMGRLMAVSEALAKNAFVRLQIKQRYGSVSDEVVSRLSDEELFRYAAEASNWLVDYRIVPPSINFLRKGLGLFPFITFFYTVASQFLIHPEKALEAAAKTAMGMYRLQLAIAPPSSPYEVSDTERELLPEWLQHPLVMVWKDPQGNYRALDLTYWLPLGVFEGFLRQKGDTAKASLKDWLLWIGVGLGDTALNQVGSLIRPLFELVMNKSVLTGQEIVSEVDPAEIRTAKRLRYIIEQVPVIRSLLKMAEGAGVPLPFPRFQKSVPDPVNWLDNFLRSFFGLRAYKPNELAIQKEKAFLAKVREIKQQIKRIAENEKIPLQRRMEIIRQYEAQIEKMAEELQPLYRVPILFNPSALRDDRTLPTQEFLYLRSLVEDQEEGSTEDDLLRLYAEETLFGAEAEANQEAPLVENQEAPLVENQEAPLVETPLEETNPLVLMEGELSDEGL